jgi:transcriptional regulator with XRE-family HTH domain
MVAIDGLKQLGGLLRYARRERGLTVQEVAERAGVTPSRISQVERAEVEGALQLDTLDRFAAALGYRLRYELVPGPVPGRDTGPRLEEEDAALPMLASESVGGPYRVGSPSEAVPLSGLAAMIAEGRATPARRPISELPPPVRLTDAQRAAIGGRTVSEMLIEEREADTR